MARHGSHQRAASPQQCALRSRRPVLAIAFATATGCIALAPVHCFLTSPAASAWKSSVQTACRPRFDGNDRSKSVAAAAGKVSEISHVHAPLERPMLPNSTEEMTKQAADAAMRGYQDGITRQTVRLTLETSDSDQDNYIAGSYSTLKASLSMADDFTRSLWGGDMLKGVRTQAIDQEVATLLYRQASNRLYDSCVFFMTGRDLVTSDKLRMYFDAMGDRLIVLLNSEDATDPFKVQEMGRDWVIGEDADAGRDVTELFREITYYFAETSVNNWQLVEYRAYPHPWEIWIENLNYKMVKLAEFNTKPTYDDIMAATKIYEAENAIPLAEKLSKASDDENYEFDPFRTAGDRPNPGTVAAAT